MTFERNPGPAPEPGPTPVTSAAAAGPTPVQLRLQILSTEHWSLLSSRGLAWNESFTRASMFLSTLSGAMVALGLIGGIDHFGDAFVVFALVILPVVLFVGIATFIRMSAANYHDAIAVVGMNRIRGAYLEIAPDLEPYFVMGVHDDRSGVALTMAVPPNTPQLLHLISATPFVINVLNSVVGGAIVAIVAARLVSAGLNPTIAAAVVGFAVVLGVQLRLVGSNIRRLQGGLKPMFPTPGAGDRPGT
jgi:hypothetical protein